MGCTAREKHVRANRRVPRPANYTEFDPCVYAKTLLESGLKPLAYHLGLHDPTHNNSDNNSNSNFDDNGWGYCTEEQLEETLLKNLDFLYKEAISKLVGLGYDEDVALKAILRNGHCYGGMDVLTNILHNSLAFLNNNNDDGGDNGNADETELVFDDLRQLEEYSLAGLVCLLQQVRPHLSKGDAMWCLLMCDLHVGRASALEIPFAGLPGNGSDNVQTNVESVGGVDNGIGAVAPALCRFHGGWGFGSGGGSEFSVNGLFSYGAEMSLQKDIECPKRFNLSPSMKSLLKRNVAMFAADFRANSKQMQIQSQACMSVTAGGDAAPVIKADEGMVEKGEESQISKNEDGVSLMLSKLQNLKLDENLKIAGEDQKDEMMVTLLQQIKDLEKQVKERKEWAHQKAMQAARKLSSDLTELKMLRMEREETQRLKKGKQTLEDSTMKRLSEMENALRKASGQVDRANAAVRRLETENAEIRAEMEASKLSASESVKTCLEVAKREKKCLKRLLAWEKQKTKLQAEIADEKEKIKELQRCLDKTEQAQKEAEVKWRQGVKEKEQAYALVEEERCSKEAAEADSKRKLEALRLKIEIDFQRHKDDLQRLDQEFSGLKSAAESTELNNQSNALPSGKSERTKPQGETIARLLHELDKLENSSDKGANCDRECMICMKDEVSIVFLPCAHQVICASCSDNYGKKGRATCPCCRVPIEQKIRVFGASS
ncbi:hypothetical protein DKX38_004261 [Salix brachista]|uniref:RING-type domain-containing protein n=1 Tax=Salix brachista TaxID=2182728 RepID=A0A5N5NB08_9ROSI|nr:hypothetical protein DKX38_004261 [Salix brachista]